MRWMIAVEHAQPRPHDAIWTGSHTSFMFNRHELHDSCSFGEHNGRSPACMPRVVVSLGMRADSGRNSAEAWPGAGSPHLLVAGEASKLAVVYMTPFDAAALLQSLHVFVEACLLMPSMALRLVRPAPLSQLLARLEELQPQPRLAEEERHAQSGLQVAMGPNQCCAEYSNTSARVKHAAKPRSTSVPHACCFEQGL